MIGAGWYLLGFACGLVVCALATSLAFRGITLPLSRRELPPATARKIRRDRNVRRPDIGPALEGDRRRWISPARADFDNEDTQ